MAEKIEPVNDHAWNTFARPSVKFKHSPSTKALIERIMPYVPKRCVCIAGYLDDADQFWKVNYHWELLLRMLTKALPLKLSPQSFAQIQVLNDALLENRPSPERGYADSKVVGEPHDKSSAGVIIKRWEVMKVCKQEFRRILDFEEISKKHPPAERWDLAAAPVAKRGTSKHGSGYALDIEGPGLNAKISQIAKALGATLAYDEKSHLHVEFKQGVLIGQGLAADDHADGKYTGWLHTGSLV
jgi:hypothetical protein